MIRRVVTVSLALTAVTAPVFLTGALSTRMRADFGGSGAAVAVTAFFVGAGLLSVPTGWVADRIGARRSLQAGVLVSGVADLVLATVVGGWWQAAAVLLVAGMAVGLVDTGGARAFSDGVPTRRQGLAFGVKEASVPAASMLAGLSIPLLAQQVGWRAAFAVAVAFTPAVLVLAPADHGRREVADRPSRGGGQRGPLVLFAVGIALGTAAATAAATLFVPAFDDRGWSEGGAGFLLAVVSAASITVRLLSGWSSDRHPPSSWWATASLMAVGAVGAARAGGARPHGDAADLGGVRRPAGHRRGLGLDRARLPDRGPGLAGRTGAGRRDRAGRAVGRRCGRTSGVRRHRHRRVVRRGVGHGGRRLRRRDGGGGRRPTVDREPSGPEHAARR